MKVVGKKHYKQYTLKEILGTGSFGKVYHSPPYAVKQMSFQGLSPFLVNALQNQIKILDKISHKNVVKLIDHFRQGPNVYLVLELCDMDLSKYLKKNGKNMQQEKSIEILKQILEGFSQLYKNQVIHRDLKPANILVNSKGEFKIADFGFAKIVHQYQSNVLHSIVGTPLYMAPQILAKKQYTTKCDIWSIGFIFYQMLTGTYPWMGVSESDLLKNITSRPLTFPNTISSFSKDLLSKMLIVNEKQRIGWEQLFQTVLPKGNPARPISKQRKRKTQKQISDKQNYRTERIPTQQRRKIFTPEKKANFVINGNNQVKGQKQPKSGHKTERKKQQNSLDADYFMCYQRVFTDLMQIQIQRIYDEQTASQICANFTGKMEKNQRQKFDKALQHFNSDFQKAALKVWNFNT